MKQILIPTDFSKNAENALLYTIDLYRGQRIKIHLLHVINPDLVNAELPLSTIDLSDAEYQNALKKLATIKDLYESNSNVQMTTEVMLSTVAHAIRQKAGDMDADIIIMGTRGTNHKYLDRVIGTISSEVLKKSPCPVLIVPMKYQFKTIDNLIFATKLNHEDPYELWRALELLKPHVAQIRCLHVVKDHKTADTKEVAQLAKYLAEHSPSIQTIFNTVENKHVDAAIEEYAETYDAELIVMHRSKKSFWENLFSKRHTRIMINLINRPLLVMN